MNYWQKKKKNLEKTFFRVGMDFCLFDMFVLIL